MPSILEQIESPEDLQRFSISELQTLCSEIRRTILKTVAANGGHLSPNLGIVELAVALEYVFHEPQDALLWDVGHQAYPHKLLTGRLGKFPTLRKFGGLSGFLSPAESNRDHFYTGHAGVVISNALGMAAANEAAGRKNAQVVAVIGDGSLGCGIALEALNNIRSTKRRNFILVINDNKMAISKSVGAFSVYLNRIITGRRYNRMKTSLKVFLRKYKLGRPVVTAIQRLETATKSLIVSGALFDQIGLKYVGPLNGHDLPQLIERFQKIRDLSVRPVVVHVLTQKGRGCPYAEDEPEKYHGVSPFDPETGKSLSAGSAGPTFSAAFAAEMEKLAGKHKDIVAITAAMSAGTKLTGFAEKFPDRFYDVGIAEEHAVAFAGGLASGGLHPVVAIYATFFQRALDCIFHDVCLQNLPVILCADRAGVVEDGPTHHGIYDLPFLLNMPNLSLFLPRDAAELAEMLHQAYRMRTPVMIRYPRGSAANIEAPRTAFEPGKADIIREGSQIAIWCAGRESVTGLAVAELLKDSGISAAVVNVRSLKPFDSGLLLKQAQSMMIVSVEDSIRAGALAAVIDKELINVPHRKVLHSGWPENTFTGHGSAEALRKACGFSAEQIALEIKRNF